MQPTPTPTYQPLAGKKVILGVCGGIAAYKAVLLLRLLTQAGAEVQVVMTETAKEFVGLVTFASLSGRPVLSTFSDKDTGAWHNHVELGLWADAMVVAPATAATLAKAAHGQADNLLLAVYLSARCPVLWCPAMDLDMYAHPTVRENLNRLKHFGNEVLEAASGALASGLEGQGRLPEPDEILETVRRIVSHRLVWVGKRVLVTAGPTQERIDPVRYIGNFSSGKMGYALAHELAARGAEVVLVSGHSGETVRSGHIHRIKVESAEQMAEACQVEAGKTDLWLFCAAVADYRPSDPSLAKTKKTGADWNIRLVENVDIAATLGTGKRPGQRSVGFALESGAGEEAATSKLVRKHLDMVCLNSLDQETGSPLGADSNAYTLLMADGNRYTLPTASKAALAAQILDVVETLF